MHVINTHKNFQAAAYVTDKSTAGFWKLFVGCWPTVLLGFPEVLRVDHGSSFNSTKSRDLAESKGVKLQFSGTESHNVLGKGERYHTQLRSIFRCVRRSIPTLDQHTALLLTQNAFKDTTGTHGLVPSYLVFCQRPYYPTSNGASKPCQKQRLTAMAKDRTEIQAVIAEQRII